MLFSVVIPCYNSKTIEIPLASLVAQIFRDFEVIIVDDNSSDTSYYSKIEDFQKYIPIRIVKTDYNGGCGVALQKGLEESKGDYYLPIDDDDMFAAAETLLHFARLIQQHNYPDVVATAFAEYDPISGRMTPIDQNNSAFVHGKAYNIQFLKDNNIVFPKQKWFEDGTFNFQVLNISNRIARDPAITYLWQHNPNSITRSRDYNWEVQEFYTRAYDIAFPRLYERDPRKAYCFLTGLLMFGYFYWNCFKRRKSEVELLKYVKMLDAVYKKYNLIQAINDDEFVFQQLMAGSSSSQRAIEAQEGVLIPFISLNDWLKKYFNCSIKWLE